MRRVGVTVLATLAVAIATASPAHATRVNTFEGECTAVPGTAAYPDGNLRAVTGVLRLVATFQGGSCVGTVNGKPVDGAPLYFQMDVTGPMSCTGPSAGDGRGVFTIAGRSFGVDAHYRRVGSTVAIYLEGDTSGTVVIQGRAVAGAEDLQPIVERCTSDGISEAPVAIDRFAAPLGVTSPEPK